MRQKRDTAPSLADVSLAWEAVDPEALREMFPNLRCYGIGWAEPFCFRCGWLAPGPEAADYKTADHAKAITMAWKAASGWLERAHLHDHAHGGDVDAWNLVPLCVICHDAQPQCRTREQGVAFVNTEPEFAGFRMLIQMFTDHRYRERRRPGPDGARRAMLRAHAEAGTVFARVVNTASREAA